MSHSSAIQEKFLEAYDLYADDIFRHCALRLSDRELGKDLMQETFLRVWQQMTRGTEILNIRAFLYKIANNLIIDLARRAKLRHQDSLEGMQEMGFDLPDREPGPAAQTDAVLARESLDKVDEPYRTAVIMRFVDGLPPRDIAELLGVSPNVVSVRIHRGIKQLESLFSTNA